MTDDSVSRRSGAVRFLRFCCSEPQILFVTLDSRTLTRGKKKDSLLLIYLHRSRKSKFGFLVDA